MGVSVSPVTLPPGWARLATSPRPNGVDDPHHDDGDRAGGLLGRPDLHGTIGNDEVRLETHEFSRERRGSLLLPLRPPALDDEVLARDIPALPQPLHECLPARTALYWAIVGVCFILISRDCHEVPYPIDLRRLLRLGGERGREEC